MPRAKLFSAKRLEQGPGTEGCRNLLHLLLSALTRRSRQAHCGSLRGCSSVSCQISRVFGPEAWCCARSWPKHSLSQALQVTLWYTIRILHVTATARLRSAPGELPALCPRLLEVCRPCLTLQVGPTSTGCCQFHLQFRKVGHGLGMPNQDKLGVVRTAALNVGFVAGLPEPVPGLSFEGTERFSGTCREKSSALRTDLWNPHVWSEGVLPSGF